MGDLYAGTLDGDAWRRAIIGIADMVRASGAILLSFNPSSGEVLRDESHRIDARIPHDYGRYWTYQDPRRDYGCSAPVGCPMTERSLQISGWAGSAILNEFLLPVDVPHFMLVWLYRSEIKMVALSFQGTRKRGPFETEDIETLRRISPHVSRALDIRDRLAIAEVRADTLARSLDVISFGVMVLDCSGKLLEVNTVAQELLRSDNGICRKPDGSFCLQEPAGSQLLQWISSGKPPAACTDGLLHARRANALPLSVMVTSLPILSTSWMRGDPRWLILVFDPERRVQASFEMIARDLGISAREAEVAAVLVSGYNVKEVSQRLGVSEHTIRSQLKSIFRKTETRSQSDLIQRIALGPAQWHLENLLHPFG